MSSMLFETLYRLNAALELNYKDYMALKGCLEQQFKAALAHDAMAMEKLAEQIIHSAERIEARQPQLLSSMTDLMGRRSAPTLRYLIDRLPPHLPAQLTNDLVSVNQRLQEVTQECQRMNFRNCELIHEQQALMQRLMGKPESTYA